MKNSKIKRDDPCPCGSGKKYKKCCMNESESTSMSKIFNYYDERNTEFDEMLNEGTENEVAYDNVVLERLRKGNTIREALDFAAEKYPEEALQYDDDNIDDIHAHCDYSLNHETKCSLLSHSSYHRPELTPGLSIFG
ncbi:MAG: YecA family protein [bacterium]